MSDQPISLTPAPAGYADWLAELKTRIHTAQQRAALAVNRELVLLYWQMGRAIYLLDNGILKDKSVGGGNVLTFKQTPYALEV